MAKIQTHADWHKVNFGLETSCPPFWIRTKADALTQSWWLLGAGLAFDLSCDHVLQQTVTMRPNSSVLRKRTKTGIKWFGGGYKLSQGQREDANVQPFRGLAPYRRIRLI